jgi:hypothetical protein
LDALYDDPLEFKPNALVITLYCVDIGFSTKITKNKNELPVETFYCYKKDEILLSFIENEKLPPQLLDSLNEAEPNLFYSGCVIAEVHDLRNGTLDQIGRILLRPCNEVRFLNYRCIIFYNCLWKTSNNLLFHYFLT